MFSLPSSPRPWSSIRIGRAVNAALQSEYARLAGMPLTALTAAIEPYLPIVFARALLGPAGSPALRERLLEQVESALRPAD
jgi:hypothetical protein